MVVQWKVLEHLVVEILDQLGGQLYPLAPSDLAAQALEGLENIADLLLLILTRGRCSIRSVQDSDCLLLGQRVAFDRGSGQRAPDQGNPVQLSCDRRLQRSASEMLALPLGLAQEHPSAGRSSIDVGCLEADPRVGGSVLSSGHDGSMAYRCSALSIVLSTHLSSPMFKATGETRPHYVGWDG